MIAVVGRVGDVSVPQRVVGQYKAAGLQNAEHHLVGLYIGALVAIYKGHIELDAQFGRLGDSIADDKLYLVGYGRALYPRPCKVLLLIVDLEGIDLTVFFQSFCHTEGTIATEGAYLEDALGTYHLNQHLQ